MNDFDLFLKEYNITEEQMNNWMKEMDINHLLEVESSNYYKKKSPIHGIGLFAGKNFRKEDHLGIVVFGDKRTTLGRWTNHGKNNNVNFIYCNYDDYNEIKCICKAIKDINKGEELIVNYRNHNK
tara:strand:+ start:248 stop:622 length:375 start_codon:yes stop_codon:yes gene_type:complete